MTDFGDEKGHFLAERLGSFETSLTKTRAAFEDTLAAEQTTSTKYSKLVLELKSASGLEQYAPLRAALSSVAECVAEAERHRTGVSGVMDRMQGTVVQRLQLSQEGCVVPARKVADDRQAKVKAVKKTTQEFVKLSAKGAKSGKIEAKRQQLLDEEKRLQRTNVTLDRMVLNYEQARVEDMRDVLEEFLRAELFFHCRAIEALSKATRALVPVDGAEARTELGEELAKIIDAVEAASSTKKGKAPRRAGGKHSTTAGKAGEPVG